jgi:hypothetical protein
MTRHRFLFLLWLAALAAPPAALPQWDYDERSLAPFVPNGSLTT